MAQLVEKGLVIRVARGIYCYPKKDKVWNTGFLPPSYDDIANAIAKKEHAKIVPTGIHALNRLGLSEQIPMRLVYLTSGRSRTLQLTDGQTLQFIHTPLKNLAFHNKTAMLVTLRSKRLAKTTLRKSRRSIYCSCSIKKILKV